MNENDTTLRAEIKQNISRRIASIDEAYKQTGDVKGQLRAAAEYWKRILSKLDDIEPSQSVGPEAHSAIKRMKA
jgi:hypothetical protein